MLLIYVCTESFLAFLPFYLPFWLLSDFQTASKRENVAYKLLFSLVFAVMDLAVITLAIHLTGGV